MNALHAWPTLVRRSLLSLPLAFVTGCSAVAPIPAEPVDPVCPGTRVARADLADTIGSAPDAVLVTPWGERVIRDGAALIDQVDARCAE